LLHPAQHPLAITGGKWVAQRLGTGWFVRGDEQCLHRRRDAGPVLRRNIWGNRGLERTLAQARGNLRCVIPMCRRAMLSGFPLGFGVEPFL
jgi:hypothetical protein